MKYKCIRGYLFDGKPVAPGDVVELDERTAAALVYYNKLVPFSGSIETRDPVVEHRDPVVSRPGRKPRGR